ncbi:MAG TPA: hypothetical protein VG694_02240 [Candidatus Paceibacterota bacterium]|jgi:hypothetical protein|nr:hypothetical protein [Candidatus Paceibacterota bacterium]
MQKINIRIHSVLTEKVFNCAKSFLIGSGYKKIARDINREFLGKIIIELGQFYQEILDHNLKSFEVRRGFSRRDFPQLHRQNDYLYKRLYARLTLVFNSELSEEDFIKRTRALIEKLVLSNTNVLNRAREAIKRLRVKNKLSMATCSQIALPLQAETRPWKY